MKTPCARVLWALCLLGGVACSDDDPDTGSSGSGTSETDAGAETDAASSDASDDAAPGRTDAGPSSQDTDAATSGEPESAPNKPANHKYVTASVVFGPESNTSYLNVLDSLDPQELDYEKAVEKPGWADLWVHEGKVFVSNGEDSTITKYAVSDAGELVEEGRISFSSYAVDVAFWSNTFVAKDKAYIIEGTGGYVIWNPDTLEITGTFELPKLPERDGLVVRAGTLDRANVIRDGKLYTPMYWSDEDYFTFAPDSRVVVIDIATDQVLRTIETPCAGLDIGSIDDKGNLYFSTWTSGVYEPLLDGKPSNCVATIPSGTDDKAESLFTFAEVAEGREGAAVRNFRDGKLFLSIFHNERVDFDAPDSDPADLLGQPNWRTWVYDTAKKTASQVESLDWNSGATYIVPIGDQHYVLVPGEGYASTTVVAVDKDLKSSKRFDMRGWGTRLFQVR